MKIEKPNFRDKSGNVYLVRCPECGRDNYTINIASGMCTWCGFDGNNEFDKEEESK
jgi:ribosomal protein L37E